MVIDLGTDGEDRILQVRWADGSVDSVRPDELRLQEAVTMSNARKLIEAVVQGHNPRAVVENVLETEMFRRGQKLTVDLHLAKQKLPAQQFDLLQKDLKRGGGFLQIAGLAGSLGYSLVAPWGANPAQMMIGNLEVPSSILRLAEALQEAGGNLPQMVNGWWNTIADTLHSFSKIKYSLETEFGETDPTVRSLLRSIGRLQQVANQESRDIIDAILTLRSKAKQNPPHLPGHMTEDIAPDPFPQGPPVGTHPGAGVPPNPEDPCFMYRTSFDSGGDGPHAHIAMLDDTGNGTTDEEMGSQHSVLRFEVQPDPKDGHVHTLDQGTRRDVPSSQNGEGFSFHLLQTDPNRFSY